jgi:hypothetical protein
MCNASVMRGSLKEEMHTRTIVKRVAMVVAKPVLITRISIRLVVLFVLAKWVRSNVKM